MQCKIGVFSCQAYDRDTLSQAAAQHAGAELRYFETALTQQSVSLCQGLDTVCVFVNDTLDESVVSALAKLGVRHIALRCAGYNNVDLKAAKKYRVCVTRVPAYSPHSVAEHAIALMLTLNRKTHRAFNRVREGNFNLNGLMGFTLHGKRVGVIGTGHIGKATAHILKGFGCEVLCYDPQPDSTLAIDCTYTSIHEILSKSDIITLHCPLNDDTYHLINRQSIGQMKDGVMLINTSRGALIDTKAMITGLKSEKIGSLGIDVYEQEASLFFSDHSMEIIHDDIFERLQTFPNVLITGHQGFFTREAMEEIASVTLANIVNFCQGRLSDNNRVI
ncbi:2-hydroxyacid dehydrogenase [Salinimonas sp. HHU 13199]|uniref:2-hydroxyacid dehydrogenase n=1 Tax=Salinimonas profundi TaxID=2729140 RepID=A0ABR8LE38_9ALTE|nr:2-hydroxyacid dehydrogenase [Salinimonas profundi]MBD3584560.1 2-hydroxyacid dehydrogenase [Salinimonas profundi]